MLVDISTLYKNRKSEDDLNDRQLLLKFFLSRMTDKKGGPYSAKRFAIQTSHLKIEDLYYSKSIFTDTENRRGRVAACKEFWWSIKPKK